MHSEFRQLERAPALKVFCTECECEAQGNCSWTDGSGEICDACAEAMGGEEV